MIPKNFKSILQDDCDRLYKKFDKLTTELGALNKGISDEYLQSLHKKERDLIMEKAVKMHLQFVPLINLHAAMLFENIDEVIELLAESFVKKHE